MRIALLFFLLPSFVLAAEVSSIRESAYEWECQTADGARISGHARQDKAFQSCFNAALATGQVHYVVGGRFRVSATDGEPAPPEPPAEPPSGPPPEPSPEQPQVTFGPVSAITEYPASIGALRQSAFRWEITFTLNSIVGRQGLASRDQAGTLEAGHLSVWVQDGVLTARHQDACDTCGGSGEVSLLQATTPIIEGEQYTAVISVDAAAGIGLFVEGVLEASDVRAWGTRGNNLPLIVGGSCSSCSVDVTVGPSNPIDGSVFLAIYDAPLPLPEPVSIELHWQNPTHYESGDAIQPGELAAIRFYRTEPGSRRRVGEAAPDVSGFELTDIVLGARNCFVATAVAAEESADSNSYCRSF